MSTGELAPFSEIDLSAPPDVLPRWLEAMQRGDFESAWRQTDRIELQRRRAQAAGVFQHAPHHLVWDGRSFCDRIVLVRCEHGLGDTIQFVRYLPRLRKVARKVILKAQPALLDLLAEVSGADQVINAWTDHPDPPHDLEIECMEFPYAFRDTVDSVPARAPYLPMQAILERSKIHIPTASGVCVGIIWAASTWDDSRSIPLDALAPLAGIPGVTFYSLQQGEQQRHAAHAPFPVVSLSDQTTNIADAAAAMLQMDLIITADSMTAHLAGALGCPVWVVLKSEPDWRWMNHRPDSPWYPTMRLFRQRPESSWATAAAEVSSALRSFVALQAAA